LALFKQSRLRALILESTRSCRSRSAEEEIVKIGPEFTSWPPNAPLELLHAAWDTPGLKKFVEDFQAPTVTDRVVATLRSLPTTMVYLWKQCRRKRPATYDDSRQGRETMIGITFDCSPG